MKPVEAWEPVADSNATTIEKITAQALERAVTHRAERESGPSWGLLCWSDRRINQVDPMLERTISTNLAMKLSALGLSPQVTGYKAGPANWPLPSFLYRLYKDVTVRSTATDQPRPTPLYRSPETGWVDNGWWSDSPGTVGLTYISH